MLALDSLNPRNLWLQLPLLTKLFALFLCAVSIYTSISLVRILFCLRSLKNLQFSETYPASIRRAQAGLQNRFTNLRQLLLFTFYLFAFCFLLQMPAAFNTFDDSKLPVFTLILMQLATYVEYATDVLFLFLLLHSVQWLVSLRVQSFTRQQEPF